MFQKFWRMTSGVGIRSFRDVSGDLRVSSWGGVFFRWGVRLLFHCWVLNCLFIPRPSPGLKHILAPLPRTPLGMPQRIDLRPEDVRAPPDCSSARPSPSAVPHTRVPSPPPWTTCGDRNDVCASPPAFYRDPRRSPFTATLAAAHRVVLYKLASSCRARCTPAAAFPPNGTGYLVGTNYFALGVGIRSSRDVSGDLRVGSWGGVVFRWGVRLLFHCWVLTCLFTSL